MSLCDWPGRVSAVLFLGGCDLRCPTCHNFHLAWNSQSDPCIGRNQILTFLKQRAIWLDGLVITGGEAALSQNLPDWLAELRTLTSLPIKLDTNGMHPETLKQALLANAVDLIAVDLKGPWSKYPRLTGNRATAHQARAALTQVFALAADYPDTFQFRTTLVPQLSSADIREIQNLLPSGFSLRTQPFRPPKGDLPKETSC